MQRIIDNDKRLRNEFRKLLLELCASEKLLSSTKQRGEYLQRFEALYHPEHDKEFRHYYSDIWSVIIQIKQNGDSIGDVDILAQNVGLLFKYAQNENLKHCLRKLFDHVSLDIGRIQFIEGEYVAQIGNKLNDVSASIENIRKEHIVKFEKYDEQMQNSQRSYIAILGIFAAIVVSCTATLSFSTSCLEYIHLASIYRVTFAILLIGLVMTNMLFGLFFYIHHIVDNKSRITLRPLLISNAVMLSLMLLLCVLWNSGFVEKRNRRIPSIKCNIGNTLQQKGVKQQCPELLKVKHK